MLDQSRLLESPINSVLGDCLQGASTQFNGDVTVQFRHPKTPGSQIWQKKSRRVRRYVLADPALFFGHTTPVNGVPPSRLGSGDAANS
jgi:hypothetical protein